MKAEEDNKVEVTEEHQVAAAAVGAEAGVELGVTSRSYTCAPSCSTFTRSLTTTVEQAERAGTRHPVFAPDRTILQRGIDN